MWTMSIKCYFWSILISKSDYIEMSFVYGIKPNNYNNEKLQIKVGLNKKSTLINFQLLFKFEK